MKLCIIGLGKMGSTLIKGFLDTGLFKRENIIACDINTEDNDCNQDFAGIKTTVDNKRGAEAADLILLAVKPQVIDSVLKEIKEGVAGKLVISIAAGVSTVHLEKHLLDSTRTVRVMPNTPALVQDGISAIAAGSKANKADLEQVARLFTAVGEVVEVKEEMLDAVTGLSGSGPAFIYMIIEAMADGGVVTGLSRSMALKLAARTVHGAAKMVLETGMHPGELKDMVTSPAGTSIRGIEILERHGLRGIMIDAVKEASARSKELNNY